MHCTNGCEQFLATGDTVVTDGDNQRRIRGTQAMVERLHSYVHLFLKVLSYRVIRIVMHIGTYLVCLICYGTHSTMICMSLKCIVISVWNLFSHYIRKEPASGATNVFLLHEGKECLGFNHILSGNFHLGGALYHKLCSRVSQPTFAHQCAEPIWHTFCNYANVARMSTDEMKWSHQNIANVRVLRSDDSKTGIINTLYPRIIDYALWCHPGTYGKT